MTESMYYLHRVIASWFQALGVVVAVAVFVFSVIRTRKQTALDRYNDITTGWSSFFKMCRDNPDLDINPLDVKTTDKEGIAKLNRESASILEILTLLERAYVLDAISRSISQVPHEALANFIKLYINRESFLRVYQKTKQLFDIRFVIWIDEIIENKATNR